MEKIKELLQQSLNIDFIAATLSNPREKDGLKKVKVRPILKKGVLLFQCEEHQNNQVFHEREVSNGLSSCFPDYYYTCAFCALCAFFK